MEADFWMTAPLQLSTLTSGLQQFYFDQCQHGAMDQDARGLPNRKRTWLITFNFTVSSDTALKCEGDNQCPEHGELRGKIPGTSLARTALSAVYPWNLCLSVIQDIRTNLKALA